MSDHFGSKAEGTQVYPVAAAGLQGHPLKPCILFENDHSLNSSYYANKIYLNLSNIIVELTNKGMNLVDGSRV